MNKSTHNFGNSVLGQLISLIPNSIISNAVEKHKSDWYVKRFTTLEHLVTIHPGAGLPQDDLCLLNQSVSDRIRITNLKK